MSRFNFSQEFYFFIILCCYDVDAVVAADFAIIVILQCMSMCVSSLIGIFQLATLISTKTTLKLIRRIIEKINYVIQRFVTRDESARNSIGIEHNRENNVQA